MDNSHYEQPSMSEWSGRVDSDDDYDAFRWHQWVAPLDLLNSPGEITGRLKFAFLGLCCDEGIRRNQGRPGASKGPMVIRQAMANLPCRFAKEVRLYDAGDISCKDGNLEESQAALAQAVNKVLSYGCFPIILGGGHEVALGHYKGHDLYYRDRKVQPNIGIINFDAHFDIRPQ
jgi:formiminoglutamase